MKQMQFNCLPILQGEDEGTVEQDMHQSFYHFLSWELYIVVNKTPDLMGKSIRT